MTNICQAIWTTHSVSPWWWMVVDCGCSSGMQHHDTMVTGHGNQQVGNSQYHTHTCWTHDSNTMVFNIPVLFPTPPFFLQMCLSACPWMKQPAAFCIHESHCRCGSRSWNAYVCWWSYSKQKDFGIEDGLVTSWDKMHSEAMLCLWATLLNPSHSHSWWCNYTWCHWGISYHRNLYYILVRACSEGHPSSLSQCSHPFQIPLTNPYPGPQSILVLDNCSIQHAEEIHVFVEESAHSLIKLISYLNVTYTFYQNANLSSCPFIHQIWILYTMQPTFHTLK